MANRTYLKYWLIFVSSLALFAAILGFKFQETIKERQFSLAPQQVSPLAGRLYSIWTLLACVVRLIGAFFLHERGACLIVLSTFLIAIFFFAYETFITQTVPIVNSATPFLVASISSIWVILVLPSNNSLQKLK